jgi:hypothetical protein
MGFEASFRVSWFNPVFGVNMDHAAQSNPARHG